MKVEINGVSMSVDDVPMDTLALATLRASIASKITACRLQLGMTKKQFAEYMGVSTRLVSRWENCEGNFNLSTLVKISQKLPLMLQCPLILESSEL